jgi:cell division protein FtsI/penicillin-binding protein 2
MAVQARRQGAGRRAASRGARRARPEIPGLRVLGLLLVACLLAAAIWGRLAYWQIVQHASLEARAAGEQISVIPLPATRGMIFDHDGRPLAINTIVYDVSLAPDQVSANQRERVADSLAGTLGVSRDDVLALLESDRKFAYVAKREPQGLADQLRSLRLPGVYLQPQPQRAYLPGGAPGASLASNLLGFVDDSGDGQRGVEQYYQRQLGGRPGFASTYRDPDGRSIVLGPGRRQDPVNGVNLTLTVDRNIQFAAEQAIAQGVAANHAQSGSVVIMDSQTGGIVAEASYPSFDANLFRTTDPSLLNDPAVSDLYEPGSVMKVVTLSGGLDAGKITPKTTIYDPTYVNVGGYTIHDEEGLAHGRVTMTTVLDDSLNVGAVKEEQIEGPDAFFHYLGAFGFGHPSGVDLADEAALPLRPPAAWPDSQVATAAFGQGVTANLIQMCAAINVVANQGRWVQPHVVERIGGRAVPRPPSRQVIRPETAATMTRMMQSVVQHGSGWKARIPGFELDEAGKTGTAQIPEHGRYSDVHVWASYVGFLPAEHPRFTMIVLVERPNNGSWDRNDGYYVAAPIWKNIAQQLIVQAHLTPQDQKPLPPPQAGV